MYGATKKGEYSRTADMLQNMTGRTRREVMMILYFLYDSQYSNKELKEIADTIAEELKVRDKNTNKD